MEYTHEWLGPTVGGMLGRKIKDGSTQQLKIVRCEDGTLRAITLEQFKEYEVKKENAEE